MADVTGTIDLDLDGTSVEVTGKVIKTGSADFDLDGTSIEVDVTPKDATGTMTFFLDT